MTKQELLQNAVGCLLNDYGLCALFYAIHSVIDFEADSNFLSRDDDLGDLHRQIARELNDIIVKHNLYPGYENI